MRWPFYRVPQYDDVTALWFWFEWRLRSMAGEQVEALPALRALMQDVVSHEAFDHAATHRVGDGHDVVLLVELDCMADEVKAGFAYAGLSGDVAMSALGHEIVAQAKAWLARNAGRLRQLRRTGT